MLLPSDVLPHETSWNSIYNIQSTFLKLLTKQLCGDTSIFNLLPWVREAKRFPKAKWMMQCLIDQKTLFDSIERTFWPWAAINYTPSSIILQNKNQHILQHTGVQKVTRSLLAYGVWVFVYGLIGVGVCTYAWWSITQVTTRYIPVSSPFYKTHSQATRTLMYIDQTLQVLVGMW